MRLSFSEIRQRAIQFGHDWKDETSERAEAQSFWNDFFNVFGIHRRSVASFERTVRNLAGAYDRIDVIWQGVMLGEHKSRGADLSKAATQAMGYVQSLTRAGRDREVPRYIIVSDFSQLVLHDLEAVDPLVESVRFQIEDLHEHIRLFDFLNGIQSRLADPEDPINIEAVEVLGTLHDTLEAGGYGGHKLERLLVRLLFCLFSDDTGIFEPDSFKSLVEQSREDGSDLGPQLDRLFRVLDTPETERAARLPDELKALPYVNGQLFTERLELADFDFDMRNALLAACRFQWAKISPAVFGSLFQSIMAGDTGKKKRRQIGAHYTSERDIMKLVRSLFLDDLRAEFDRVKSRRKELLAFHEKLAGLKFLDPACGCGNFLVVTYRELRRMEHEVIDALFADHGLIDIIDAVKMNVDQMHGIEIEEWPARIAEVAMWLIDHQMNLEASQKFGKPLLRLPLKKSAKIFNGNALRVDWNEVLPATKCSFVMGNPPFVGKKEQNASQKADFSSVWNGLAGAGVLDYVTCWHLKAASYMRAGVSHTAFVSTNSICQGEQVGVLWGYLLQHLGIEITFAYTTFSWMSEARGKAHVHVVIVGLSLAGTFTSPRKLYETVDDKVTTAVEVDRISAYLTRGPSPFILNRSNPINATASLSYGSFALDDGKYTLEPAERDSLILECPNAAKFVHRFLGAREMLHGEDRFCIWLADALPAEIRSMPPVLKRVEAVRAWRLTRDRETTRQLAETPALFAEMRQPSTRYVAIPTVSSERRTFIPMMFLSPEVVASNQIYVLAGATLYHFGILSSTMHMAWVRQVCGRLKSDFRYSNKLVYNNYPWPESPTAGQRNAVENAAQGVLDAREQFPGQTLADLYDPLAMPKPLRDAHRTLDRAVDRCYRPAVFDSDRHRVEYLFGLYERLTSMFPSEGSKRRKRKG